MRTSSSILVIVPRVSLALAAACSSPLDTGSSAKGDERDAGVVTGSDGGKDASPSENPADSGADTSKAPTKDEDCFAESDPDQCVDCCGTLHAAGGKKNDELTVGCICVSGPSGCQTACADSFCSADGTGDPSNDCQNCVFGKVNDPDFCKAALQEQCGADTECGAFLACHTGCK